MPRLRLRKERRWSRNQQLLSHVVPTTIQQGQPVHPHLHVNQYLRIFNPLFCDQTTSFSINQIASDVFDK
ncbi:hypothetical protein BDQ17DRAFT_1440205 [Cyathus striatus]|nr:hypothetical protein BDQ17DRAFT_1440205 [Cyathus striatus]